MARPPSFPDILRRVAVVPMLATAALALLAGSWAGLLRLGWNLPPVRIGWVVDHGPLMIGGFLGTLICLERAIALKAVTGSRLPMAVPTLAALGGVALLFGLPGAMSRALLSAAGLGLVAIFADINRRQPNQAHMIMGLGALAWLTGNLLWWSGRPVYQVMPWWVAFLLLTIAGERLELARVLLLKRWALAALLTCIGLILAGSTLAIWRPEGGVRLAGLGLLALGLWLLRFDIARRTARKTGLTRFMAICMLLGYAWLAAAGVMWVAGAAWFTAGPWYDAMLHSVLLGFVFSMIFAHAPIILPAVTGRPMPYRSLFYFHLLLLHASVLLRVWGDLALLPPVRQWGGALNVAAILLFIANSAAAVMAAVIAERRRAPAEPAPIA